MKKEDLKDSSDDSEFVKWFSEIDRNSVSIAGGKGANLGEIYNLNVPVPQGFIVTTKAYDFFMNKAGIMKRIEELLSKINYDNTKKLDKQSEEIRKMIVGSKMPKEVQDEILESYETLGSGSFTGKEAHEVIDEKSEEIFVAVRSSATTEDLADASFAGQQDTFLNVKGGEELIENVKKCIASLFTSRAIYYRGKKNFSQDKAKLAVVVQRMVESDKSGVVFSKDPSYKNDDIIIESVFGFGEGIVSGKITPDRYRVSREMKVLEKKISDKKTAIIKDSEGKVIQSKLSDDKSKMQVLREYEIKKLAEIAMKLEKHYGKPQDIEFAIEKEKLYIVQTRAITTVKTRIEKKVSDVKGEVVLDGNPASPGIAFGKVKIVRNLGDLEKVNKGDVLVTKMTNPDMVVAMQRASAIVTNEGGITSHAAIISREMGIPCVVGTEEATVKLKEPEIVTVDGFNGKVYKGKVSEIKSKEVEKVSSKTRTRIKVTIDIPKFAERASETGVKEVGLLRIEGIIAESGKHPEYFVKNKKYSDYEEVIFKGADEISKHFDRLWVRTSDVRSDEFKNLEGAPKEPEVNPMLGMHGIRYSLKNPEILKAEIKALKRISDNGKKIGIMFPQIISVDEIRSAKKIIKDLNCRNVEVGIMVETPAAVQVIRDICKEGINFISFGTNDLTQYTLAIDRGNSEVQELYDEMNPAVLNQLGYVIRACRKNKILTSICGQAANRKEMVKFLVENKIDSISVSPDSAKEISDYVAELEGKKENKENL